MTLANKNLSSLIPELACWNQGDGIDVEDWISGVGRFDHALGYLTIFWPHFVKYDFCFFRRTPDKAIYEKWMATLAQDRSKVEAMMNHLHIIDLFTGSDYLPSKPLLLHLTEILQEMWTCKLKRDFPENRFDVRLTDEDDAGPQLTFFRLE